MFRGALSGFSGTQLRPQLQDPSVEFKVCCLSKGFWMVLAWKIWGIWRGRPGITSWVHDVGLLLVQGLGPGGFA